MNSVCAGPVTVMVGGQKTDQTVSGKFSLKADCTGQISYDVTPPVPAPKLNINFIVLDQGKEIRGLPIDTGTNLLCNLSRMEKRSD